jgi:hypothetical protein
MDCPHCNSPSADGKKYCADCGTPRDPQTAQTAAFVRANGGHLRNELRQGQRDGRELVLAVEFLRD